MKIYYFSGATLPSDAAQSVHVMKMCAALAGEAKANAVTLFAKGGRGVSDEEIFSYYGVEPCFSLVLSANPKVPVLTGILRLLGHRWALREMGMPDIAYGRDPVELDWLIPENVQVVYEVHEMPSSFFQDYALINLIKRKNFKLVVISRGLKADFMKKFRRLDQNKIIVAPDGADVPKKKSAPRELPGRSDVLKVGYTGSLHEGKGMEVIAVLAREAPDFDFHVVGGAPGRVKEWQEKKLPANLFMHGHVPHGELGSYLAAFDILIAPYRAKAKTRSGRDISRWMSPMKIFEYMAAGKPILASDLPVIREVLQDGQNALLAPPDNPKGWLAALERLKDESLRKNLAEQAYNDLTGKYSWQKRAQVVLKFVDKGK
ncbi:MAG: glycosyltransferase [Alphaproteobacteria bacterium PRO2]|nr:glycosyltransferase [Alphaproteobacteria bacterium PRO2]